MHIVASSTTSAGSLSCFLTISHYFSLNRHLKWIIKGAERLETLVSISTDGRVLEWNLKKGLVVSSLMQLKKSGTVSSSVKKCVEECSPKWLMLE